MLVNEGFILILKYSHDGTLTSAGWEGAEYFPHNSEETFNSQQINLEHPDTKNSTFWAKITNTPRVYAGSVSWELFHSCQIPYNRVYLLYFTFSFMSDASQWPDTRKYSPLQPSVRCLKLQTWNRRRSNKRRCHLLDRSVSTDSVLYDCPASTFFTYISITYMYQIFCHSNL